MDRSFTGIDFIKARSAEALRDTALEMGIIKGGMVQFVSITHVDGYWYGWFYRHLKQDAGKSKDADKKIVEIEKTDLEKVITNTPKKRRTKKVK